MEVAYERCGGVSKYYECPVCRKLFAVPFQTRGGGRTKWVYSRWRKKKKIYYCSYGCFTNTEKGDVIKCVE